MPSKKRTKRNPLLDEFRAALAEQDEACDCYAELELLAATAEENLSYYRLHRASDGKLVITFIPFEEVYDAT